MFRIPNCANLTTRSNAIPAFVAALLMVSAMGCSSIRAISPDALPASLVAAPPRSLSTIDLSRLSSPIAPSDVLQPGDQLALSVSTGVAEADLREHPVRLDSQGMANLPLVGPVQLAGLHVPEAEQAIQTESVRRGIYRQPQVSLGLSERLTHRVTVAGAVERPGAKEIPAASADLFAALSASGAFKPDADTVLEITYPPQPNGEGGLETGRTVRVDLVEATTRGQKFPLPDGAAVMVKRQQPQTIHIDGLVKIPKRIDLPFDHEFRLLDAVSEAGGRRLTIADKIYVSRIDPQTGQTRVIQASYRKALHDKRHNLVLMQGDVVTVQETPATFALESVRGFIRFGFTSAVPGF